MPLVPEMDARALLDIALVAFLVYIMICWIRKAKAGSAFVGILILGGVYVLVRQMELQLATWILQGFFAVSLILLVVIFQNELRQGLERIAVWSLLRRKGNPSSNETIQSLLDALGQLAVRRHGALVVIPGDDPLDRHLQGGIPLQGRLSCALLLSLFDPDSVGHDGAVIVEGDQVMRFSVQLPLSLDFEQLGQRGTRHGAALGLAERTDAFCIVVSEEQGTISVAHNSSLDHLNGLDELQELMGKFLMGKEGPPRDHTALLLSLRKHWLEKVASVGLALGLWVMFVSGAQGIQQIYQVPVRLDNVPNGFMIQNVAPPEIEVTLSGARREFYLLDQSQLEVRVDASQVRPGRTTFQISKEQVKHPDSLSTIEMKPRLLEVSAGVEEPPESSAQQREKGN